VPRRRNRKVGQGGEVRGRQSGLTRQSRFKYSVTPVPRNRCSRRREGPHTELTWLCYLLTCRPDPQLGANSRSTMPRRCPWLAKGRRAEYALPVFVRRKRRREPTLTAFAQTTPT